MAAYHNDDYTDEISYREYTNEVLNSQGFYVKSNYGSKLNCGITKLDKDIDFALFKKAEEAAKFSVEKYNIENNGADLEFLKILNVNMEAAAGKIFYITFVAKDCNNYDIKQFHTKVWATISKAFQVKIFREAPYNTGHNLESTKDSYRIKIDNLEAWMDENYLYYKCFHESARKLLKVKITRNGETGESEGHGLLELKTYNGAIEFLKGYNGNLMPCTTRFYKLELLN